MEMVSFTFHFGALNLTILNYFKQFAIPCQIVNNAGTGLNPGMSFCIGTLCFLWSYFVQNIYSSGHHAIKILTLLR